MQRYFASIIGTNVLLTEEDAFHLTKVIRVRKGEKIEVVNDNIPYLCEVVEVKPLTIKVLEKIKEVRELHNHVTLICALIKGDKLDFVLQKATEIGVKEIVLISTERTVVKAANYNSAKKLTRYHKILREAAMQSHRSRIPELYRCIDMSKLSTIRADKKIIAYEGEAGNTKSFWNALKGIEPKDRIAILVGPEGGFSPIEVKKAEASGYVPVSLGNRILRAETASIYALSVLSCYLERK